MLHLSVRIILTLLAILDIFIDCRNATLEYNDGRIYIEIDIIMVILVIAMWF